MFTLDWEGNQPLDNYSMRQCPYTIIGVRA